MIDTTFDFRTDAGGQDPDQHSPTLRRYHQALWSKPLPSGDMFDLDQTTPYVYLHHRSTRGEFFLSSDSVIPTFIRHERMKHITDQVPEEAKEEFERVGYTIGGMLVFPGNKVDGKMTINGARGMYGSIADRLDLTLECIRRHYLNIHSPLAEVLTRYSDFFELFEDFGGYVGFFLLQDLTSNDGTAVKFLVPFDDFSAPSRPKDVAAYKDFMRRSIEFVDARNQRIDQLAL